MLKELKNTSKKNRDRRSHEERLLALSEAFGELKEKASQSNKINDCSLTKVANIAGVNKIYLTGNKSFAKAGIAEKYRAIGQSVINFRDNFQKNKAIDNNTEHDNLEEELANAKSSVYQYFIELETIKNVALSDKSKLKDLEFQLTILQAKLADAKLGANDSKVAVKDRYSIGDRMVRTIISPDKYLLVNGEYQLRNESLKHKSWLNAIDELENSLSRSYAKRLYILVGLPCSGKSTWAMHATLFTDRHSIIFDAPNLKKFERETLMHRIKRFDDVRKCCVYFDTPILIIRNRNQNHLTRDKRLTDDEIAMKRSEFEPPNPLEEEWIEEMIVVRDFENPIEN